MHRQSQLQSGSYLIQSISLLDKDRLNWEIQAFAASLLGGISRQGRTELILAVFDCFWPFLADFWPILAVSG